MDKSFYKVWVKNDYASRVIRSLLNSDIEITNAYPFASYDDVVNEQYNAIGGGKLFKLEYLGNLAGYFIWSDSAPKKWFLKPSFRTAEYLELLNFAVGGCLVSDKTINNENTNIGNENIFKLEKYKQL